MEVHIVKKVVSLVLAFLLVFSCFSLVSSAEKPNNYYATDIPSIYIVGQDATLVELRSFWVMHLKKLSMILLNH